MNFKTLTPADKLVLIMNRIYQEGMTTTSGGNISVIDENGNIWITPSGVDKGSLTREDMCLVRPDGTVVGPHKPSMELPFHASIYRKRPELRAVIHAHPPALVAFSVARVLPDVRLAINPLRICGVSAMAEYAVPGSKVLGEKISRKFEDGFDIVVLENHGVVVGSSDLFDAFIRFETIESFARIEASARKLGNLRPLTRQEASLADTQGQPAMDEFVPKEQSPEECAARGDMIRFIRRSYRQRLFGSSHGTYSARLTDGSFLITPHGADRLYMETPDLVLIKDGAKERGKIPSDSVMLHKAIYEKQPEVKSIIGANPSHAMAFAVSTAKFDPRTIPESYLLLREIKKIPYALTYTEPQTVAEMFSSKVPALICENDRILVTGSSMLNAFDRLEVAEATARSILSAMDIGELVHISDAQVKDIDVAFNLN